VNILLLAPQPFYQNRGTPIAVDRMLQILSERHDQVDVVTYHEGWEVQYDRITIHRIISIPFVRNIRPGLSWKKLVCDMFVFFTALRLASRNHYQVIHAVEESVFIALVLKWLFKIPYVYDMDSSLAQQLVEKHPSLSPFTRLFNFFEGLAVRNAKAVVPVCAALAESIEKYHPEKIVILWDCPSWETQGVRAKGSKVVSLISCVISISCFSPLLSIGGEICCFV